MFPLSWRVPTTGDPRQLRLALAHVVLATIVAGLVILVATPRQWLAPALLGLIPLAILMAFRRWQSFRRSLAGPDNVWISETGVHWMDHSGQEQSFPRETMIGFQISRDSSTLRSVPALTLSLRGGYESQPIELHEPATPEAVRSLLAGVWQLPERPIDASHSGESDCTYDLAVNVYSECHEEFQEWHWEGSQSELQRFFALFALAANDALPPAGAKPAPRIVVAQRREATRLAQAHWPAAQFDHESLFAPASVLLAIADHAQAALANMADGDDAKFDVTLGPKNAWTFHLHVRGH